MKVKDLKKKLETLPDNAEIKYAPQGNIYYPVKITFTCGKDHLVYMNCFTAPNTDEEL